MSGLAFFNHDEIFGWPWPMSEMSSAAVSIIKTVCGMYSTLITLRLYTTTLPNQTAF